MLNIMFRRFLLRDLRAFDWTALSGVGILVAFGLAGIGSVALSREPADFIFLRKQIIFLAIGLVLMFFIAFTHPTRWRFSAPIIYIVSTLSMLLVLIFGVTVRGTRGWFEIFGLRLQPVEIMKFALILFLAKYLSERLYLRKQLLLVLKTLAILSAPMILVMLQPDAGSASVMIVLWFALLVSAGIKRSHLIILGIASVLLATFAWFAILAPYQKERIFTFLNPERDPLGSGYNVTQSLIAVGSGKLFGRGLGFGAQSQLKFLPESQTDFIFAVLSEELGFATVTVIILAFTLFLYRAVKIAGSASGPFAQFAAFGVAAVIFYEMFVNIGMNLGVMPVTGITLPFVSYGGSSLIAHFCMVGLLESIKIHSTGSEIEDS